MKLIIVDTTIHEIDAVRGEVLDWARALGVNTKKAKPLFILAQDDNGAWRAHFSLKRGPDGNPDGPDLVREGTNRVESDYGCYVVDVEQGSWPRWFPAAEEMPDVAVPLLLEAMDIADGAESSVRTAMRHRAGLWSA